MAIGPIVDLWVCWTRGCLGRGGGGGANPPKGRGPGQSHTCRSWGPHTSPSPTHRLRGCAAGDDLHQQVADGARQCRALPVHGTAAHTLQVCGGHLFAQNGTSSHKQCPYHMQTILAKEKGMPSAANLVCSTSPVAQLLHWVLLPEQHGTPMAPTFLLPCRTFSGVNHSLALVPRLATY